MTLCRSFQEIYLKISSRFNVTSLYVGGGGNNNHRCREMSVELIKRIIMSKIRGVKANYTFYEFKYRISSESEKFSLKTIEI